MHRAVGLVLIAACGGGGSSPDAVDDIDGGSPDVPSTSGSVQVRAFTPACVTPTDPASGITVYFIDPSGGVQTRVTDALGQAGADAPAGSTVMLDFGTIHAFVAVQPGDVVVDKTLTDCTLALHPPAPADAAAYQVTITNLPPQVQKLWVDATRLDGSDSLGDANVVMTIAGSTATGVSTLAMVGDHTRLSAYIEVGPESPVTPTLQYTQSVATAAADTLDASTMIRTAKTNSNPIDGAGAITWTEWPGVAPTMIHAIVNWTRSDFNDGAMIVVAPYASASFALPALPSQLAARAPEPTSQWATYSIELRGYIGKSYRDVIAGTTADAPLWTSQFF
jgi:hypothetical protein